MNSKSVIITGSSSGLGRSIAEKLLDLGFEIIGIDISPTTITHSKYYHLQMDLVKVETDKILDCVKDSNWYGFIHCAGVSKGSTIDEMLISDWNKSMEVNVNSAMHISRLAHEHMVDNGRIILVGSPVSVTGSRKPSYSASKAALHGLTMSISRSFGKRGICVNTVLPGPMITGMTNDWPVEKRNSIASSTRLNRLAKPDDVAYVLCRMLDEEWSYMSASIVDLSCGSTFGH